MNEAVEGSKRVREFVLNVLKEELVGPSPGLPAVQTGVGPQSFRGEEILREEDPPRLRYGAGVLFPRQTSVDTQEEVDSPPDGATGSAEEAADESSLLLDVDDGFRRPAIESETEQEISRANEYLPSAMGITALVDTSAGLRVEVRVARYEPEELDGQRGWTDKDGRFHPYCGWRRIPVAESLDFSRSELESKPIVERDVPTGSVDTRLKCHLYVREPGIGGTGSHTRMITFSLVNDTEGGGRRDQTCFFQCSFSVQALTGEACFYEYPDRAEIRTPDDLPDAIVEAREEEEGIRLLYRHRRVFAVGHGCAADWSDTDSNATTEVHTETLPTYEVPPVMPSILPRLELRMEALAENDQQAVQTGQDLCEQYRRWIDELKDRLANQDELDSAYEQAARRNVSRAETCLRRMEEGVLILERDPTVRRVFALLNRAMLMQQLHYRLSLKPRNWVAEGGSLVLETPYTTPEYVDTENRWRPFQFAFILVNLASVVDARHADREIVDVIWFPTGGGKTEAYLGLAGFAILFRRVRNRNGAGTVVLTRYTLRLLTTQQYQRAASLICALEYIRRRDEETFGKAAITIGLWVGRGVTPNTEADAAEALNKMLREGGRANKFVLVSCPWCGAGMGAYELNGTYKVQGYRQLHSPKRVRHICSDPDCEFSDDRGLPVLVTDEAIYQTPPTLVIGTVDKFALLPWYPQSASLFGLVNGERRFLPPDMIIQDELHLISGPLGSMVGHYETVIDRLCTAEDGVGPKIVASTATIARAGEQVRSLYARKESFLFPPQGLEWGNSFFAEERPDLPGRCYVGVFASALPSQQTATVRVFASLLQAPLLCDGAAPESIDPYWTLMAYFNSIRELGSAATLVSADIREYMRVLHGRLGLTGEWQAAWGDRDRRRWLRRPTLELTSRIPSSEIGSALQSLFEKYSGELGSAVDVCLATNMIQVGLDVSRLGLMAVAGQPKTTSEYIQATSRIGREMPGLVAVLLNPSKPRDRSHYEHFRAYHERIYSWVEPTSVTPFSVPVRERALHALAVALVRAWGQEAIRERPDPPPDQALLDAVRSVIRNRVDVVDHGEVQATEAYLNYVLRRWTAMAPARYGSFGPPDEELPLMFPFGSEPLPIWDAEDGGPPWPTPSSMRSVDASCELGVARNMSTSWATEE